MLAKEPAMITAVVIAVVNLAVLYGLITADAAPLWIALAESVVVLVGGYFIRSKVTPTATSERMGRPR
jgi:hypothetical protein